MKEIIFEGNNLTRFIGTHIKKGFAIVSACRGEKTEQENNIRTNELKALIKNAGFSFKEVAGGFIENKGTSNEKEVHEKSFVIYNFKQGGKEANKGELLRFAMQMCKRYNQDSILYREKGDKPRYYTKNGKVDSTFKNKFIFNDKQQEYFTDLKKGKNNERFTLDWQNTIKDKQTRNMQKKANKAASSKNYFPY